MSCPVPAHVATVALRYTHLHLHLRLHLRLHLPLTCNAAYEELGPGNTTNLTACTCGHVATFNVGFVTVGPTLFIATVGFECSSGQQLADPGAAGLALSSTLTTGQCSAGGCGSFVAETVQVSSLPCMVGMQGTGAAVYSHPGCSPVQPKISWCSASSKLAHAYPTTACTLS